MELALSLGDTSKPFSFLDKSPKNFRTELGFCMALGKVCGDGENDGRRKEKTGLLFEEQRRNSSSDAPVQLDLLPFSSSDAPVQLDLLPFSPVHGTQPSSNKFPFPWLNENLVADQGRRLNEADEEGPSFSSPNSAISSFRMNFSISARSKRDFEQFTTNNGEGEADRGASSRGSDEEENGVTRKKLRLSKEQSAFLEESFKEHNTLNPKEKLALAKQLNLSPRQVEVWFQNRRARTKLKQTESDCEYLKKCFETLTEENRRLQKELQELRALKASKPFYMQLPATTLTMCPSCERVAAAAATTATAITAVATTSVAPAATTITAAANKPNKLFSLSRGDSQGQQADAY